MWKILAENQVAKEPIKMLPQVGLPVNKPVVQKDAGIAKREYLAWLVS